MGLFNWNTEVSQDSANRQTLPRLPLGEGWTGFELVVAAALICALMLFFIWVIVPVDRYREARNAARLAESNSLLHAILLKQYDDGEDYRGEPPDFLDDDPTSAQILVRQPGRATCVPGLATTPTCPGAVRVGLRLPTRGQTCLVTLDDNRFNAVGLSTKYLLGIPIDPSGPGADPNHPIAGLPLGENNTGYYVNRGPGELLEVGACQPELGKIIRVRR